MPRQSSTGLVPACALEAALKSAGVTAIVTTQFKRTQETARPLAGAPKLAYICETEFDNLFVVRVSAEAPASVVHALYGAATPAGVGFARVCERGGVVLFSMASARSETL